MGFIDNDICTHCSLNTTDDYNHVTWLCPPIQTFWTIVTLTSTPGHSVPVSPSVCRLWDLSSVEPPLSYTKPTLIALTIAKKTILPIRKTRHTLSVLLLLCILLLLLILLFAQASLSLLKKKCNKLSIKDLLFLSATINYINSKHNCYKNTVIAPNPEALVENQ